MDYKGLPPESPGANKHWLVCRETFISQVRHFDIFSYPRATEPPRLIEGPHTDVENGIEIYITFDRKHVNKRTLLSIGVWTSFHLPERAEPYFGGLVGSTQGASWG